MSIVFRQSRWKSVARVFIIYSASVIKNHVPNFLSTVSVVDVFFHFRCLHLAHEIFSMLHKSVMLVLGLGPKGQNPCPCP